MVVKAFKLHQPKMLLLWALVRIKPNKNLQANAFLLTSKTLMCELFCKFWQLNQV